MFGYALNLHLVFQLNFAAFNLLEWMLFSQESVWLVGYRRRRLQACERVVDASDGLPLL